MRLLAAVVGIALALGASVPALAQRNERRELGRFERFPPQRVFPAPEWQRRPEPPHPAQQMTPEERRQLRQDIREHGREVYRDRAPRSP